MGTPIGNLEDMTLRSINFVNIMSLELLNLPLRLFLGFCICVFDVSSISCSNYCRALRVLKSADVILSEDTRHSGKLLHYYNIKTPLVSCLDVIFKHLL